LVEIEKWVVYTSHFHEIALLPTNRAGLRPAQPDVVYDERFTTNDLAYGQVK